MRRTKIVSTIGPASNSPEMLEKLALAGVNVFRLNFSHGSHESHLKVIQSIRALEKKLEKKFPIILDTKGPDIRTADVKEKIILQKGDTLTFTIEDVSYEETGKNKVSYKEFVNDVAVGDPVVLDSGLIEAKVVKKTKTDVVCEMLNEGTIGSRRHINLPGKNVSLPSITEQDWKDIEFGVEHGLEFCAMSFVRTASDIEELRSFLKKKNSPMKIIPKIECLLAVQNLSEIMAVSDGAMVARGDLGVEVPFAEVPKIQYHIIEEARENQIPVIVATEMLDSMITTPMPTRAEVADVANAVWQRTDATMLSGETASGEFPVRSVEAMADIAVTTEEDCLVEKPIRNLIACDDRTALAKMASKLTEEKDDIAAVLVVSSSGKTAQSVSIFRPKFPLFAFSNDETVVRQMQLLWGVVPYQIEFFPRQPEETVKEAQKVLLEKHPEYKGKKVALVSGVLVDHHFSLTIQLRVL